MGIGLIIAGFIFLINPNINIVDLLPDFIGYILIWRGLYKLGDIDDRLMSALKKCRVLVLVSLAKMGCILMLPTSAAASRDSDVLTFTFCFMVVELLLTVPLFSEFFGGMNYLCSRFDNDSALKSEAEAKFFVILFVILKNALPLIPELFTLASPAWGFELRHDHYRNIHDMEAIKRITILGVFAFVLIFGIFVAFKFISYLNKLRGDTGFISRLDSFYRENILTDTAMWARRYQNFILTLFAAGIMLFNNFYLDTVPVIPDFLGYILIIVGALYLSRLGENGFDAALVSIVGIALNIVSIFHRLHFSAYGAYSHYYYDYCKEISTAVIDIASGVVLVIAAYLMLRHARAITLDNPDDLKIPVKPLMCIIPFVGFSTAFSDLLPLFEGTSFAHAFPDYYAFGAFIIPTVVLIITAVTATQLMKMRTYSNI